MQALKDTFEDSLNTIPEEILCYPAKILTQEQREHYFEYGFVEIKDIVPTNNVFDICPGHSHENFVLRRLKSPDENYQEYWNFSKGIMTDVASNSLGLILPFTTPN